MPRPLKQNNQWLDVDGGKAFIIPFTTLRHMNFLRLSPHACKLLLDLSRQSTGFNNGYLCAAWSILKPMGWRSEATIREAIDECLHYGMIVKSRQGGRNRCNLFAFTWQRVHEKPGKPLDIGPTMKPTHEWKEDVIDYVKPLRKKIKPRSGGHHSPPPVL